jgi:hypothetical protein
MKSGTEVPSFKEPLSVGDSVDVCPGKSTVAINRRNGIANQNLIAEDPFAHAVD